MPIAPQPSGRGGYLHSFALWGGPQRQDEALWGRAEVLPIPAVGHGTDTHQKVTMQEPQGQMRKSELVYLLPSSSSSASPASPFPAQHLLLVQGQAELGPASAAMSVQRSGRQ